MTCVLQLPSQEALALACQLLHSSGGTAIQAWVRSPSFDVLYS